VVIYGEGILNRKEPQLVSGILELANLANPDGLKVISLKPRGNSWGAWGLGAASRDGIAEGRPKLVYVLLADDEYGAEDWVAQAEQAEFLVVQASYTSPLTQAADVVLPSPIWAERSGEYISLDGKAGLSRQVLKLPPGIRDDSETFDQLTRRLKKRRPTLWRR
jgi:NADH dehydrogenase/NADH:ubiquinone oxidoreductase subunit G